MVTELAPAAHLFKTPATWPEPTPAPSTSAGAGLNLRPVGISSP